MIATALVLLLSLPVSLLYARVTSRMVKRLILFIILLPLFINQLLQSYGWISLLGPTGIVNNLLVGSGIVARPLRLLYTETGVIAMAQFALPLAVPPSRRPQCTSPPPRGGSGAHAGGLRVLWEIVVPPPGRVPGRLPVGPFQHQRSCCRCYFGGCDDGADADPRQMGPLNWRRCCAGAGALTLLVQRIAGLQRREEPAHDSQAKATEIAILATLSSLIFAILMPMPSGS